MANSVKNMGYMNWVMLIKRLMGLVHVSDMRGLSGRYWDSKWDIRVESEGWIWILDDRYKRLLIRVKV